MLAHAASGAARTDAGATAGGSLAAWRGLPTPCADRTSGLVICLIYCCDQDRHTRPLLRQGDLDQADLTALTVGTGCTAPQGSAVWTGRYCRGQLVRDALRPLDQLDGCLRVLKVVQRSANKNRTLNQLRNLIATAPDELRGKLRALKTEELISTCAAFRVGAQDDSLLAITRLALRELAQRSAGCGRRRGARPGGSRCSHSPGCRGLAGKVLGQSYGPVVRGSA